MPTDRPSADKLPRAFGRLWLLRMLARGGMGEVYLASTTGIEGAERPCVVKTIRREHVSDRSFLARFLDEARVQSQLQHPGVAQVLEASHDAEGEPYVVVEYVEGRSLGEVRRRAISLGVRITWPEAVAVAISIAEALGHVHERTDAEGRPLGIVHRDLSPQNVMVGYGGEVKLIDFGTARGQNRRCHTIAGVVFAKPGYVAPEVANGDPGDHRVDLYALGVMFWELLAGRRFLQGDPQEHLAAVAKGERQPPPIAKLVDAPEYLDAIIARLCAFDREERFGSGRIAAAELAKLLVEAPSLSNGERGVRARIAQLMYGVYPSEPARSRVEFQALVQRARTMRIDATTPADRLSTIEEAPSSPPVEGDPGRLPGTGYRILRELGQGAMGIVYEAEHVELGRRVALKVLAPEHATSKAFTQRFRREARAMSRLSHPGLVTLHDFGQAADGRLFCAMELLEGETLERRLAREQRIPWREVIELGKAACDALSAAHAAGVVHRDLKPANLFLTASGQLKILDFGIAKASLDEREVLDGFEGMTLFGTPEYMAPEQARRERVDARADVYALGCVLYELLTGERPFLGGSAIAVLDAKRGAPIPPSKRVTIPRGFDLVLFRALAFHRDDRFATAAELRRALLGLRGEPTRKTGSGRALAWAAVAMGSMGLAAAALLSGEVKLPSLAARSPELPAQASAPIETEIDEAVIESEPPLERDIAKSDVRPPPSAKARPSREERAVKPAPTPPRRSAKTAPVPEGEDALLRARRAAERQRSQPGAQRAWAEAAALATQWEEAVEAAEAWARLEAGPQPRIFLARMLARQGRHAGASAVLVDVLDDHPESDEARALLRDYGGIEAAIASGRMAPATMAKGD